MNGPVPLQELLRDARLAPQLVAEKPAWLFEADTGRLLFANASAAAALGHASLPPPGVLARRGQEEVSLIARSLPPDGAPRLQRLRGLSGRFGEPRTCACRKLRMTSGLVLLVAALDGDTAVPTLEQRLRYLLDTSRDSAAAFDAEGKLLHATADLRPLLHDAAALAAFRSRGECHTVGDGDEAVTIVFDRVASATDTAPAEAAPVDLTPIAEAIAEISKAQAARAPATRSSHPLRFTWQTDADNRFTLAGAEFLDRAGPFTRDLLGRHWSDISERLALDPENRVAQALASRHTWSAIDVPWPMANGKRMPVTLSGIPAFDAAGAFNGYRGFGVQRVESDVQAVQPATDERRESDAAGDHIALSDSKDSDTEQADAAEATVATEATEAAEATELTETTETTEAIDAAAQPADIAPPAALVVSSPENVVPFPAAHAEAKTAHLDPQERSAFHEIGSRLSARLRGADEVARGLVERTDDREEPPLNPAPPHQGETRPSATAEPQLEIDGIDSVLLDRLPYPLLIYRPSGLLYANPQFLKFVGQASLSAFAEAGGLDSLFIETEKQETPDGVTLLRVAPSENGPPVKGQLVGADFDGEKALLLALSTDASPRATPTEEKLIAQSRALAAVLDVAADGVLVIDRHGAILEANPGAERLFGVAAQDVAGRHFASLLAGDSECTAKTLFARAAAQSRPDSAEVMAASRQGQALALQLTLARIDAQGERYCAVLRDISRLKETERDLAAARERPEKASANSELLARMSHEMRTPLNTIVGFSELMIGERFGSLGNERYREYLKDIAACGEELVRLLDDVRDLSKIESGKAELRFESVNLNAIIQDCVAAAQAEAGRARVIIRSALSMEVSDVLADARALRDIVSGLLLHAIASSGAGGQVIVSTAATERGQIMLRIRDSDKGMRSSEVETSPPLRAAIGSPPEAVGSAFGLPLIKTLAEANRAQFSVKRTVNAGTLVEVLFSPAAAWRN